VQGHGCTRGLCCPLIRSGERLEGAGLRSDTPPLCPGFSSPPVACLPLLGGWLTFRLAEWRRGSGRNSQ
jgi:hypothetical protein